MLVKPQSIIIINTNERKNISKGNAETPLDTGGDPYVFHLH